MRPAIILFLLSCSLASAQERSELHLNPPILFEGYALTLQYRPARPFAPAPGESVVVEVLAAGTSPRVYDVTLRRGAGMFLGSWTPPSGAEALVLRVAVGDRIDDRNGAGWAAAINAPSGEPVARSRAWLARAGALGGLHGFRARVEGVASAHGSAVESDTTPEELHWRAAVAHRVAEERWSALAKYLEEHPGLSDEARVHVLVRSAIAAGSWDAADELIHRQPRKEPMWLIALAEGLMSAHVTLDRASVLAKESVNASRNWDPAWKPALLSLREFRDQRASEVPLGLRTYARSLVKLGHPALAEKVYHEAFEVLEGRDVDVKNEYVAVLRTLGKGSKAAEVERTFMR